MPANESAITVDPAPDALLRAEFNPLIQPYLLLYIAFLMAITIIGLPFALIWLLGVGQWWSKHYFDKLQCELSEVELRFRKGILFQVEKTVPLENIQDVTFVEGPVLKYFHLSILKFETAGQSAGQAHDMQLIGIIDAHAFRQRILDRRRAVRGRMQPAAVAAAAASTDVQLQLLTRISARLDEIAELLHQSARREDDSAP